LGKSSTEFVMRGSGYIERISDPPDIHFLLYGTERPVLKSVIKLSTKSSENSIRYDNIQYWSTNNSLIATNRISLGIEGEKGPMGVDGRN